MTDLCQESQRALILAVEQGSGLEANQRRHFEDCPVCGRILQNVRVLERSFDGEDATATTPALDLAPAVRSAARRREILRLTGGAVVVLAVSLALVVLILKLVPGFTPELVVVTAVTFGTLAVPLAAAWVLRRLAHTSERPWYRRLRPGRRLAGVCLGTSERLGVSPGSLRAAFVLLCLFQGLGFWIYLTLAIVLPVHPDDRSELLRFRIRRAWRRTRGG